MSYRAHAIVVLLAGLLPGMAASADTTIAFGSCLHQWQAAPVWQGVLNAQARAFVFMGDNVYSDTEHYKSLAEPERIGLAYAELGAQADYQRFRERLPIYAVWDDHDYGHNDGGADYRYKAESKTYFMDFFAVPVDAPMRSREGVYARHWLQLDGRQVQLILLDTRSFRSPLRPAALDASCPSTHYVANPEPQATILGRAQWRWLEQVLREPADQRILVSSIQVIPSEHCWEKWANFPRERERLLSLLHDSGAHNTVIVSGDRHHGEISRIQPESWPVPLFELTASGLNSALRSKTEANRFRVHPALVLQDHFGAVHFDGERVELELRDVDGRLLQAQRIEPSTLPQPTP